MSRPFHQLFVNGSRRLIANTGVLQYEKAGTGYEDLTDYGKQCEILCNLTLAWKDGNCIRVLVLV